MTESAVGGLFGPPVFGSAGLLGIGLAIYLLGRWVEIRSGQDDQSRRLNHPLAGVMLLGVGVYFLVVAIGREPVYFALTLLALLAGVDSLDRWRRRRAADRLRTANLDREWSDAPPPKKRAPF